MERAEVEVIPVCITFPLKAEEGANADTDTDAVSEVSSRAKTFMLPSELIIFV